MASSYDTRGAHGRLSICQWHALITMVRACSGAYRYHWEDSEASAATYSLTSYRQVLPMVPSSSYREKVAGDLSPSCRQAVPVLPFRGHHSFSRLTHPGDPSLPMEVLDSERRRRENPEGVKCDTRPSASLYGSRSFSLSLEKNNELLPGTDSLGWPRSLSAGSSIRG